MDFYIFQADVYCEDCGKSLCAKLDQPEGFPDERQYDSGEYPKGPYDASQEESDTPMHCAMCHIFLENPLTQDGYDYIREQNYADWNVFYGIGTTSSEMGGD